MFRQKVMGLAARGMRFNSTQATKPSFVATWTAKASGFVKCATYWSKVTAELAKQVYIKEGFAPPSIAQFQTVYKNLYTQGQTLFKRYVEHPQEFIACAKSFNKQDAYKFGAIGIQFAGLFALGEIIGRRHINDYPHH
ncbi:ATP synthase subunit g, mitochondrial [Trichomonascus vanleenenianus]|uniref:F1F0 ATP synthase subunit g n=1 Tax=Trichomonascus vanleenenianus TaxID=2268995 RepID=UPI003ECAF4D1